MRVINILKSLLSTKKRIATVVVLILVIGGFFGLRSRNGKEYETFDVKRGKVAEELILSGEVLADEYAKLKFATAGKIAWVGVKEGDVVKKGAALTKLDTTNLNSDLQKARSTLRDKEAIVLRVLDDVKDNDSGESFTQKENRTTAEVAKDKAYEDVIKAEYNIRGATLFAPFAGTVTSVARPFPGENVLATENQITIINPSTIYFEVSADQTEVVNIKNGDKVVIMLDALSDKELVGSVAYVSFTPDENEIGTVYEVKVVFDELLNGDFIYRVGLTGDAKFILDEKEGVLWAPPAFLKSDKTGDYVLVNEDEEKSYVEIGLEGEDRVQISGEGISEGLTLYD